MAIHPSALIDPKAEIDGGAEIGPFCVIGPDVKIAAGVKLHANVIIEQRTEIGEGTQIFPFACIGMQPQDLKYRGEETGLRIGKNTVIREYVTVHRALRPGTSTTIGDHNMIMVIAHVAHDCVIGTPPPGSTRTRRR